MVKKKVVRGRPVGSGYYGAQMVVIAIRVPEYLQAKFLAVGGAARFRKWLEKVR